MLILAHWTWWLYVDVKDACKVLRADNEWCLPGKMLKLESTFWTRRSNTATSCPDVMLFDAPGETCVEEYSRRPACDDCMNVKRCRYLDDLNLV